MDKVNLRKESLKKQDMLSHITNDLSKEEINEMIHELQVHQIELEVQNEELRSMQHQLEGVRDQYTDLFDFSPVCYFVLDKNGVVINVNLTACSKLGLERRQIKGKPFSVFIVNGEEGNVIFFKHLQDLIKTKKTQSCDLLIDYRGKSFPAHLESIVQIDDDRGDIHFRTALHDRTGEKKTEKLQLLNEALRLETEKAQQYLQLSGVFFISRDVDGVITMINKTGCEILGYKCEIESGVCQIEGLNWFDHFIPTDKKDQVKRYFDLLLKEQAIQTNHYENYILTRTGEKRLISWNNVLIKDSKGRITGTLSSGEDITEQRKSEIALIESEKMFRTLFENATESILITNKNGEIIGANQVTKKLFGYEKKELVGQQIELLIPTRFRENHSTNLRKKHLNNNIESRSMGGDIDIYALKKDGSEFPVEVSLSKIKYNGKLLIMAMVTDVTEQKKAQEKLEDLNSQLEQKVKERTHKLKESQRMYSAIARNFPNGVINVLDKNLKYVFVEGMEMFRKGITGEMLIGTSILDRIEPSIKSGLKKKLMSVFKGKELTFELKIEKRIFLINAVGLREVDNDVSQILIVTQNITNLKKAERQIRLALEKEQHLNELKSRFVSMASHEFRTPLTAIMNSVSLLSKYAEKSNTKEKQLEHVDRIKTSIKFLTSLLNDFLSLEKLEKNKVEIDFSTFNLPEFCHEITVNVKGSTKDGQQVIYEHSGKEDIYTDPKLLKNIFYNLLSNAIKYSSENSSIIFNTSIENETLIATIIDSGIGIPEEDQIHLFERFFRAKNAANIQGTGLGLNILKKYLDLIGGGIHFKSIENKGTKFTIKIPFKMVDDYKY